MSLFIDLSVFRHKTRVGNRVASLPAPFDGAYRDVSRMSLASVGDWTGLQLATSGLIMSIVPAAPGAKGTRLTPEESALKGAGSIGRIDSASLRADTRRRP